MTALYSLITKKTLQSFFNKAFVCKSAYKYSDIYEEYSNIWYKYVGEKENLNFSQIINSNKVITHTRKINTTISNLRGLIESDFFDHLSIISSLYYWDDTINNLVLTGSIEALFLDTRNGDLVIFKTKDNLFDNNELYNILVYDLLPAIILKSSGLKKNIITYLYDPICGTLNIISPNYKRLKDNYEYITTTIKSVHSRMFIPYMEKNKCKSCLCRKQCKFSLAKSIEGIPIIKINHQFVEDLIF